jgi:hypothetical protein
MSFVYKILISILRVDRDELSALTQGKTFLYQSDVAAETQIRSVHCGKRKMSAPIVEKVLIFAFVQSSI